MTDPLESLDFDFHPACQMLTNFGPCRGAASSTAFVHVNNNGLDCADAFAFICTECLMGLLQVALPGAKCGCCDRSGVNGFLRHVHPIPVGAS